MNRINTLILVLCGSALFAVGCAELRDPITGFTVGRMWGEYHYRRTYPVLVDTQDAGRIIRPNGDVLTPPAEGSVATCAYYIATATIDLERKISTKEVWLAIAQFVGAVGMALGIVLPFIV